MGLLVSGQVGTGGVVLSTFAALVAGLGVCLLVSRSGGGGGGGGSRRCRRRRLLL